MACRRVELTFKGELIKEPVIYRLGKDFPVITNIRRAQVEGDSGWVVLELQGELDGIESALEWVRSLGVGVTPVDGDILAGD